MLEAMEDDEMQMSDYLPETFDEFSAPQSITPSGFLTCAEHEEVVFATCVKQFYKFIDQEWQPLGPSEVVIFLNKLNGHERIVVWSLKATKAILCNFPVTPYIENYIAILHQSPCLFCHTLSSNYVLNIPEIPTAYTSDARVFIPEFTAKSAIFAIKFDPEEHGSEACNILFRVFAESIQRAKKISLLDRQTPKSKEDILT